VKKILLRIINHSTFQDGSRTQTIKLAQIPCVKDEIHWDNRIASVYKVVHFPQPEASGYAACLYVTE
jgi:hypothetical protein